MTIDKATIEEYKNAPQTINLFTKSSLSKVNGNNDYFHAKIGDSKRFVCYKVIDIEKNDSGNVVGLSLRKIKASERVCGTGSDACDRAKLKSELKAELELLLDEQAVHEARIESIESRIEELD
jgi:hypothetical protein